MTDADERRGGDGNRRGPPRRQQPRQPKQPKKVSPDYLERAALYYLERFASSAANLRRVLLRKVQLSARAHGTDPAEGMAWVDALVERYVTGGLLNDAAYAEMKAVGLQRRGGSTRRIRDTLAAKGVAAEQIDRALDQLEGAEEGQAELEAAISYARRRRIGPFRNAVKHETEPGADAGEKRALFNRELSAMARAGFDLETARHVLSAEDIEALKRDP